MHSTPIIRHRVPGRRTHSAAAHEVRGGDRDPSQLEMPLVDQLIHPLGILALDQVRVGRWRMHPLGAGGEEDSRRGAGGADHAS